ncbi:MAG: hypothetical protein Q8W45_12360 [Candidatus Palauibacterales bacterium]|nr:hypothetical protein [Candidatus Palauibacterales bacterium]
MPKKPEERDSMAREVDRLLKQLPGADPTLQSDPDQPPPRPQTAMTSGPRPAVPPPRRPPAGPTPLQQAGVWARSIGALAFGAALTQWPYRSECGWSLYAYLGAVAVVLLTAGWAAIAAWRMRNAVAHVLALVAGFWGIVLAAEQILPRVGYAAETHAWRCGVTAATVGRPTPRPIPAVPADSMATAESTAGMGSDSAPAR